MEGSCTCYRLSCWLTPHKCSHHLTSRLLYRKVSWQFSVNFTLFLRMKQQVCRGMCCGHCMYFKTTTKKQQLRLPDTNTPLHTVTVLFPDRANKDLLPSRSLSVFMSLSKHIIHHSHKQLKTAGSFIFLLPPRDAE